MDIIGQVTPQAWERMKFVAGETLITKELQAPFCPYIIAIRVNDNQLLAITGRHTHGKVELIIQEVRRLNKEAEKEPIPEEAWEKARDIAHQLQLKACEL